jgi:hypothetical protein
MKRSIGLICLAWCGAVLAQVPPAPAPACTAAEHRQFDFWLGRWNVFNPKGKQVGTSEIESFAGGCGIEERWASANGITGRSLNIYDKADRRWHQSWVGSDGTRLTLDGAFAGGAMVLTTADGAQRVTWTANADGSVRQHWEATADGGKTWTTQFDGHYVRKDAR